MPTGRDWRKVEVRKSPFHNHHGSNWFKQESSIDVTTVLIDEFAGDEHIHSLKLSLYEKERERERERERDHIYRLSYIQISSVSE
jgi:hypothetical protein